MGLKDAIRERVKSGVKSVKARVEKERAMGQVLKETRENEEYSQRIQFEKDKVKEKYSRKKKELSSPGGGFGSFVFGSPAPVKEVSGKGKKRRSSRSVDAEPQGSSFSMDGYLNGPRETERSSNPFSMGDYIHGSGGGPGPKVGMDLFDSGSDVSNFLNGNRKSRR